MTSGAVALLNFQAIAAALGILGAIIIAKHPTAAFDSLSWTVKISVGLLVGGGAFAPVIILFSDNLHVPTLRLVISILIALISLAVTWFIEHRVPDPWEEEDGSQYP